MFKKLYSEKGSIAVIVALAMTVFLGFTAFAVDMGRVYSEKSALQNAADAASLAGVVELPTNKTTADTVARNYFTKNGFVEINIDEIKFEKNDRKIRIVASAPVEYTFAKIFNNGNSTTVNIVSAAEIIAPIPNLDYAIFSGNEINLDFSGNTKSVIDGDVHSNGSIGGKTTINGKATYIKEIDNSISIDADKCFQLPKPIPMPDFSYLDDPMPGSYEIFPTIKNGTKEDVKLTSADLNAYKGYKSIYVHGNLVISQNAPNEFKGALIATGKITFNGSGAEILSQESFCMYTPSTEGIEMNGAKSNFSGVIAAPNGTVNYNGAQGELIGSIYGKIVDIDNQSHVQYDPNVNNNPTVLGYKLVE